MNPAQKHLLVFISKKFVYQAEIRRSTFSDFTQICLSTNSVHHLTFYRLIKSSKTNVGELTLKCKSYYIMEIWNCICKANISSAKIFLHLSAYPEHFLYYPSSFPVILLPYKKAIPVESPQL